MVLYRFLISSSDVNSYTLIERSGIGELSNSCLVMGDFCCLLITFANSLETDQDRQNISLDLDLNQLTL